MSNVLICWTARAHVVITVTAWH